MTDPLTAEFRIGARELGQFTAETHCRQAGHRTGTTHETAMEHLMFFRH
jgi:hypothetical protein